MVFRRKKKQKVEQQEDEEQEDTEITEPSIRKRGRPKKADEPVQEDTPEVPPEVEELQEIIDFFRMNYDGIFTNQDFAKMDDDTANAVQANLMFAIFAELKKLNEK